jgi:dihydrofolate synthase / folylpolyglutamate synthase
MTFRDARDYLLGTINETVSRRSPHRLDRMATFLRHLGDPHLQYPTVHVGGTSGKGSTATMIAAALGANGLRVGLHTKPHLSSMTERARIDGNAIPEERFGEVLESMLPAIEATAAEFGRPTYYETLLALAFVYFAAEGVAAGVIEVGIGGTLDGTNLIRPDVSVITNVGLDHTDVLGDTVEEIATDKAGIVKPGTPLVSDAHGAARAIVAAACAAAGAPFLAVDECAAIEARPGERYGQSFDVTTAAATYRLDLPVLGRFQQRNAATAILALENLREELRPPPGAVERGFANLVIPGRMEFFPGYPAVIFDVAHNPDKAAGLAEGLRETFPSARFTFVIAVSDSKDAVGILGPLFELPSSFIFTSFETPGRSSARPLRLVNVAEQAGFSARAIAEPVEALALARRNAEPRNVVVVTGSTFVVGELRDWWLANVAERSRT